MRNKILSPQRSANSIPASVMPWWGKPKEPKEPKAEPSPDANAEQQKQAFDPDKLPAREKLPRRLQNIVEKSDQDSRFFDDVIDG